jgi:hypothetical protein
VINKSIASATALKYLLDYVKAKPKHYNLFEVVGTTLFENGDWMIDIGIVGLVGKYWTVFVNSNSGTVIDEVNFTTNRTDLDEPHTYSHLPADLNSLLDSFTLSTQESN